MAIITRQIGQYENGTCTWSYDYDNGTLRLLRFRCVNDSPYATEGTVISQSTGDRYTQVVQPGTTYNQPIPPGIANRFDIGVDARGRLTGIDHAFRMLGA